MRLETELKLNKLFIVTKVSEVFFNKTLKSETLLIVENVSSMLYILIIRKVFLNYGDREGLFNVHLKINLTLKTTLKERFK